jgi:transcriptional regulator with XRE-family HTH domain
MSELGRLVKARRARDDLSIRQAASEAHISFSTLSRVEAGGQPDLATFTSLCAWLGVDPSRFFTPIVKKKQTHLDEAIEHLITDPDLPPDAADRIAGVVRDMYQALVLQRPSSAPDRSVACHLRASNVMRPGVPERLASLLSDMHTALESRPRG